MPKLVVDTLDDVEEHLREHYKEGDDGKFRFHLDDLDQHYEAKETVENLRKTTANERRRLTELEKQLSQFKGVDIEKYAALQKEHEEREREVAEKKGDFERLILQNKEHYDKREKDLIAQIEQRDRDLERVMIDESLGRALHSADALPNADKALMPVLRPRMKIARNEKGDVHRLVLDEDGHPSIRPQDGQPMTPDDLVAALKADETFGRFFKGNTQKGLESEADRGGGGGGGNGPFPTKPLNEWTNQQKSAFIAEHGRDEFEKLVNKTYRR